MAIKMRTILSKSGHSALQTPVGAKALNSQLFAVQTLIRPLELNGILLVLKHIHVDQGVYARGMVAQPHSHADIQLEYVLSGGFLFSAGMEQCRLAPGQGNVIFPDIRHAWRCQAAGAMIGILLEAVGPRRAQFFRAHPTVHGRLMPVFKSPEVALLTRQLFGLLAEHSAPWCHERAAGRLEEWLRVVLLETLMLEAWLPPIRAETNQTGSHDRHVCDQALDFMSANYTRPIHLHDMAAHVGVSERHLNRLFRRRGGHSINRCLMTLRLEKAHALLREQPRCSVKEVAFASGFSSPAYFTQCFKKVYHRLPHAMQSR